MGILGAGKLGKGPAFLARSIAPPRAGVCALPRIAARRD
jgi:hypothetical protein